MSYKNDVNGEIGIDNIWYNINMNKYLSIKKLEKILGEEGLQKILVEYNKKDQRETLQVKNEVLKRDNFICARALDGSTFTELAKEYNISRERVRQIVKRETGHTEKTLKAERKLRVFIFECHECKKDFYSKSQIGACFCTQKCKTKFYLKNGKAANVGRIPVDNNRNRPQKRYKHIYMGYKRKSGFSHYEFEHRLVMEKFLGRKLTFDEVVHHKDGNGLNNDLSNLELMSRKEHSRLEGSEKALNIKPMFKRRALVKRKDLGEAMKKIYVI